MTMDKENITMQENYFVFKLNKTKNEIQNST
jgi:hypothetical protein